MFVIIFKMECWHKVRQKPHQCWQSWQATRKWEEAASMSKHVQLPWGRSDRIAWLYCCYKKKKKCFIGFLSRAPKSQQKTDTLIQGCLTGAKPGNFSREDYKFSWRGLSLWAGRTRWGGRKEKSPHRALVAAAGVAVIYIWICLVSCGRPSARRTENKYFGRWRPVLIIH